MLLVMIGIPADVIAQEGEQNQLPPRMQQKIQQLKEQLQDRQGQAGNSVQSEVDLQTLTSEYTVIEQDQSWNRNPNTNTAQNFALYPGGQPAGNINGDSSSTDHPIDDYIVSSVARNENTATLEDQVWKTAVYFGDNTTGEPDQVIYRKLVPVGDLNGDGYADAVAIDTESSLAFPTTGIDNSPYIYRGSPSGYQQTTSYFEMGDESGFTHIGFRDINRDGFDDIISYLGNELIGDLIITWGGPLSSGALSMMTFNDLLATNPKQVMIDDVDQDSLQELVQLSGFSGDNGQLSVIQIDTMVQSLTPSDAFVTQQSFAYQDFYQVAEMNQLHLVDVNGDSMSEIYISSRYHSQKHLVPYDKANDQYETTSTLLFDGPLAPIGDLNSDGNHDFVIADTTDPNDKAHIAYGKDNLSSDLTLDVDLTGVNITDWTWDISYNRFGAYGDLNGDGADDALVTHFEYSAATPTFGRRILSGFSQSTSSSSPTSAFHQYPIENFRSPVFETEELGDVNGDGVEDFAISFYYQQKLEIYYGGTSLSSTPDMTVDLGYSPYGITSGDFNGDGDSDIAVPGFPLSNSGAQLSIFFGGSQMDATADYSVAASDFQSADNPDFFNAQNIGDVNDDGIDDFIIGSSQALNNTQQGTEFLNEAYLFYGGSSISSTPDVTLSIAPPGNEYIWSGESSAALGDINGDGIDDFAVSAPVLFDSSNPSYGEVYIYYGASNPDFSSPDVTLSSLAGLYGFGWGITAGDFTGDGQNDIAVSSIQTFGETDTPSLIQVFNGGSELDAVADRYLVIPDFSLESGVTDDGSLFYNYGRIEAIPDFTQDGKDELLSATAFQDNSHAAVYTFNSPNPAPQIALKAPNIGSELGFGYNMAVGDFLDDGQPNIVLTQPYDNNDAAWSSRVYRYRLPIPIEITSVEDVPEDQGGKVHLNLDGVFADALFNEGIYGFYEYEVQYLDDDSSWVSKGKYGADHEGAEYLEVDGLKTQPTNTDTVNNTYTFRVRLLNGQDPRPMAISNTISGQALDNLAPAQVQGTSVGEENGSPVLSWNPVDDVSPVEYLVYNTKENGELSDSPVTTTANTSFSLGDSYSGVQNFAVKARDVNNNQGEASNLAAAIYPKTIDYNMTQGWNLIGLPVDADAQEIQSVLENVSNGAIYEFNGVYQQVENIEAGKGYWVKFPSQNLYGLTGLPTTELTIELQKGWNLVSGVGDKLAVDNVNDMDEIIVPGTVYAFDQSYAQSDTVRPGNGYWVRASAAGTVTFTHPKLLDGSSTAEEAKKTSLAKASDEFDAKEKFDQLTISDGEHQRTLYFGDELPKNVNKMSYSLPPLPPGDLFDARFKEGTSLVEKDELYIKLSKLPESTISLETKVHSLADHSRFVIKEFADGQLLSKYKIDANKKVELTHDETNAIYVAPAGSSSLTDSEKPDEFKLNQNYPNPFNPTTQISYSVPEASHVTIEVFNVVGKRVATLINEEKQPGTYDVTFDGSNLASGIYLYRLQAGSYVSTRKLILAK